MKKTTIDKALEGYRSAKAELHSAIAREYPIGTEVFVTFSNGRRISGCVEGYIPVWCEPGLITVRNARTGTLRSVYLSNRFVTAFLVSASDAEGAA